MKRKLVERLFTVNGVHFEIKKVDAEIKDDDGNVIFELKGVDAPSSWSQRAVSIAASKYFSCDAQDGGDKDVFAMVDRIVDGVAYSGMSQGYFGSEEAEAFSDELKYMMLNQMFCFNSPALFNVGRFEKPQVSACFINSVEDDLESILDLVKTEGLLFRYGSGSGTNLSPLRSSGEKLFGGGCASGPVAFLKGYDAFAGIIRSGGRMRRAAKMNILNVDHPDIEMFIEAKTKEEKKALALIEAGYEGGINGEAFKTVALQNVNLSVRVIDKFMNYEPGELFELKEVVSGKVAKKVDPEALLRKMAECAWECGDPGLQFDDTINEWNPLFPTKRIDSSNPCGEFMFINDSACNLGSLNLVKFFDADQFQVEEFCHAVDIAILAMDIFVDMAGYPTKMIADNSHRYRPLGLGYTNLGALLMRLGVPYDSATGRNLAASITSLMGAEATHRSIELAARLGKCEGYDDSLDEDGVSGFRKVIGKHTEASRSLSADSVGSTIALIKAEELWKKADAEFHESGIRNSQVTLLAPTGTISFLMDCDTTGIEPDVALVKEKKMSDGGTMRIENNSVAPALKKLGYSEAAIKTMVESLRKNGDFGDAFDGLKKCLVAGDSWTHKNVFECAIGDNAIPYLGHLDMMEAVQPFLSGAISKTINIPSEFNVADIVGVFRMAHQKGLKSITVYRDGSKCAQPLVVKKKEEEKRIEVERVGATRERLPDTRKSITHKFTVAGHDGYLTVGTYDDGRPGEVFIVMAKQGSTISGLFNVIATLISIALQYGVSLEALAEKFKFTRFEPCGITNNEDIRIATSIVDYIFKWLEKQFIGSSKDGWEKNLDGLVCPNCGSIMTVNGSCQVCHNCGVTSGCS